MGQFSACRAGDKGGGKKGKGQKGKELIPFAAVESRRLDSQSHGFPIRGPYHVITRPVAAPKGGFGVQDLGIAIGSEVPNPDH